MFRPHTAIISYRILSSRSSCSVMPIGIMCCIDGQENKYTQFSSTVLLKRVNGANLFTAPIKHLYYILEGIKFEIPWATVKCAEMFTIQYNERRKT
jgi:hypothetical protein